MGAPFNMEPILQHTLTGVKHTLAKSSQGAEVSGS
jgi:hypothetical protein